MNATTLGAVGDAEDAASLAAHAILQIDGTPPGPHAHGADRMLALLKHGLTVHTYDLTT